MDIPIICMHVFLYISKWADQHKYLWLYSMYDGQRFLAINIAKFGSVYIIAYNQDIHWKDCVLVYFVIKNIAWKWDMLMLQYIWNLQFWYGRHALDSEIRFVKNTLHVLSIFLFQAICIGGKSVTFQCMFCATWN